MIIYFSATGNCKHVAKTIARATDDEAVSMEGLDPSVCLDVGEQLGFVVPTYGWRVPAIVERFLMGWRCRARVPRTPSSCPPTGRRPAWRAPSQERPSKGNSAANCSYSA